MATPTVTDTSITAGSSAGTSISFNHTVTAGNQNNMVLVWFKGRSSGNATTATYAGSSMTKGTAGGGGILFSVNYFYIVAPTTGTNTLTVNWGSTSTDVGCTAVTLKDAAQTNPIDVDALQDDNLETTITKALVTIVDNDLVLAGAAIAATAASLSDGGGQTNQTRGQSGSTSDWHDLSTQPTTTAGTYTSSVSWTTNSQATMIVTSVKYQAPGRVVYTPQLLTMQVG